VHEGDREGVGTGCLDPLRAHCVRQPRHVTDTRGDDVARRQHRRLLVARAVGVGRLRLDAVLDRVLHHEGVGTVQELVPLIRLEGGGVGARFRLQHAHEGRVLDQEAQLGSCLARLRRDDLDRRIGVSLAAVQRLRVDSGPVAAPGSDDVLVVRVAVLEGDGDLAEGQTLGDATVVALADLEIDHGPLLVLEREDSAGNAVTFRPVLRPLHTGDGLELERAGHGLGGLVVARLVRVGALARELAVERSGERLGGLAVAEEMQLRVDAGRDHVVRTRTGGAVRGSGERGVDDVAVDQRRRSGAGCGRHQHGCRSILLGLGVVPLAHDVVADLLVVVRGVVSAGRRVERHRVPGARLDDEPGPVVTDPVGTVGLEHDGLAVVRQVGVRVVLHRPALVLVALDRGRDACLPVRCLVGVARVGLQRADRPVVHGNALRLRGGLHDRCRRGRICRLLRFGWRGLLGGLSLHGSRLGCRFRWLGLIGRVLLAGLGVVDDRLVARVRGLELFGDGLVDGRGFDLYDGSGALVDGCF